MPSAPPSRVAEESLAEARAIVQRELGTLPVRVYLFGSRADGSARMASDIDIGVLPVGSIPFDALSRLRSAFEESTIPYEVDVVDLSRVEPAFRDKVLREGVAWVG